MLTHDHGKIIFPEINEPVPFLFFILVDGQVNIGGEAVKILYGFTSRVKCTCIGKVIRKGYESFCQCIGIIGMMLLIGFPTLFILFEKKGFSHGTNISVVARIFETGAVIK